MREALDLIPRSPIEEGALGRREKPQYYIKFEYMF